MNLGAGAGRVSFSLSDVDVAAELRDIRAEIDWLTARAAEVPGNPADSAATAERIRRLQAREAELRQELRLTRFEILIRRQD